MRLYQSALFVKDPAHFNNATGWHRDLQFCPVDVAGGGLVTFWCPYERPLGEGDSFLHFAVGSQRDIGFEYWYGNPEKLGPLIAARYAITRVASLDVGDCTAHDGWTFHTAPPQDPSRGARKAVAFCVEIKISRRVRAASSRRPPRHLHDICSTAWRCGSLTARLSQRTRHTG